MSVKGRIDRIIALSLAELGAVDVGGCLVRRLSVRAQGRQSRSFALSSKTLPVLDSVKTLMQSKKVASAIAGRVRKLQPVAILSRRQKLVAMMLLVASYQATSCSRAGASNEGIL